MQGKHNPKRETHPLMRFEHHLTGNYPLSSRQAFLIARYVDLVFCSKKPPKPAELRARIYALTRKAGS
jgi:hypothetical protein